MAYFRFIDDILIIWSAIEEHLIQFHRNFNAFHPTIKLKLSYSHREINFLDTTIYIRENSLQTSMYHIPQKPHLPDKHPQCFSWSSPASDNCYNMATSEEYDYTDPTDDPLDVGHAHPCEFQSISTFTSHFIPVSYTVVFLLALAGNGLVLYVLVKRHSSWLLADHYLFQLALSDLLLALTLPFRALQFRYGWAIGHVPCKILGGLFNINIYTTIFFLACISMNRYFSIVRAIELHKMQRPIHTIIICIFIWVFSCVLSWQEFYFQGSEFIPYTGKTVCVYMFPPDQSDSWRISLQFIELSLGFIIPLGFMTFSYSRIFCTLQGSRLNHSRRSQLVVVILLVVFVCCWMPYKTLQLIDSLQRSNYIKRDCNFEHKLDVGMIVSETLGLSHVCINPIVYAFVGVKFRREIYKIFKTFSKQMRNSTFVMSREGTVVTDSYSRIM
ncbi:C-X-C chemokine receptor type 3-2-like [Hyperolius riggenbachi]|uniref:C-X-C chemokine receptor type 3-2-like n=1 Tax=Hyperolius riggenbachi TaxID=752182 RepID=UPI0035A36F97